MPSVLHHIQIQPAYTVLLGPRISSTLFLERELLLMWSSFHFLSFPPCATLPLSVYTTQHTSLSATLKISVNTWTFQLLVLIFKTWQTGLRWRRVGECLPWEGIVVWKDVGKLFMYICVCEWVRERELKLNVGLYVEDVLNRGTPLYFWFIYMDI